MPQKQQGMVIDAEIGQQIVIDRRIKIVIEKKDGRRARIRIIADKSIPIEINRNQSTANAG